MSNYPIILLAITPVLVVGLFAFLPPLKALFVSVLGGWMFLPQAHMVVQGMPDYDKAVAVSVGVMLATAIFQMSRIMSLRPRLADVFMLVYCTSGVTASVTNDLGLYDGGSTALRDIITVALPYITGRLYLQKPGDLANLVVALVAAGLIYAPLCLLEVRLAPQLHKWVYGFTTNRFVHNMRYDGFRPTVFMHSGLAVGMFMSMATMLCAWVVVTRYRRSVLGVPVVLLLPILLVTAVLVKAIGAAILGLAGFCALLFDRQLRFPLAACAMMVAVPGYIVGRSTGVWHGEPITTVAEQLSPDRAQSFAYRLGNEDLLAEKALQRPLFGWGGWSRARVFDENGKDLAPTDGHWIILLGNRGIYGLTGYFGFLLLPPLVYLWRAGRPKGWRRSPEVAASAGLAIVVILYACDCLPNAMYNPLWLMMAGGLANVAALKRAASAPARVAMAGGVPGGVGAGFGAHGDGWTGAAGDAAWPSGGMRR